MVLPVKKAVTPGHVEKKRTIRGSKRKLISSRSKMSEKRRSVLGEPKYGPGSEPHWKAGSSCYPALYKDLLDEPSRNKSIEIVRAHGNSSSMRNH